MGNLNQAPLPFKMRTTSDITSYRAKTFWTKEPETIQWIRSFQVNGCELSHPNPTFVDVGANVGIYSLYAAFLYPALRIIAIEPDSLNYIELVRNIRLNNFNNIIPMNLAIGAYNRASFFSNGSSVVGNSSGKLDKTGGRPILSITIDYLHLISKIDFLKIDIDGGEYNAIYGMRENLGKIDSMLIEMDSSDERYARVLKYVLDGGYVLNNEINFLSDHSRHRRKAEGNDNIENIVFKKKSIREDSIQTSKDFCPDLFEEDEKARYEKWGL